MTTPLDNKVSVLEVRIDTLEMALDSRNQAIAALRHKLEVAMCKVDNLTNDNQELEDERRVLFQNKDALSAENEKAIAILDGNEDPVDWRDNNSGELVSKLSEHLEHHETIRQQRDQLLEVLKPLVEVCEELQKDSSEKFGHFHADELVVYLDMCVSAGREAIQAVEESEKIKHHEVCSCGQMFITKDVTIDNTRHRIGEPCYQVEVNEESDD